MVENNVLAYRCKKKGEAAGADRGDDRTRVGCREDKPAGGTRPLHDPAQCLLGIAGQLMGIFKDHQLELRIQRSHRSIPFEDILEIRDQGLVFLVEMV